MAKAFINQASPNTYDLSQLVGCTLVDISEGAEEDGTEHAGLVFYNSSVNEYIRLYISENSELYLSEFEPV